MVRAEHLVVDLGGADLICDALRDDKVVDAPARILFAGMETVAPPAVLHLIRVLHPDEVKYSWWSYRFHAREKNAGWRIDYFIVSRRIADKIRAAEIHNEIFGSDHCPVELDIDL